MSSTDIFADTTPLVIQDDAYACQQDAARSYTVRRTALLGFTPQETADVLAALGIG